jgi:hypothetical protein
MSLLSHGVSKRSEHCVHYFPATLVCSTFTCLFQDLRRRLEGEILEHADVVCTTCVGAGDPRLQNFRFQHVSQTQRLNADLFQSALL